MTYWHQCCFLQIVPACLFEHIDCDLRVPENAAEA